jgi:hypothetical protein
MKTKRRVLELFAVGLALTIVPLAACSGGASGSKTTGAAGATPTGGTAGTSATAGTTGTGGAGTTGAAGDAGTTGTSGAMGAAGASGTAGGAGASGAAGAGGTGGSPATNPDASVDATSHADVVPLTGTVKMMVVGSSNELITCWRAFLWRELQMNGITNFAFVGQQNSGPDCGVPGYDMHLQAQSGVIITNKPASEYAGWFTANPPQIILMHFGGADLLADMPVDGVMKAYSTALAQARLVNPNVILLIAQHTPEGKDAVLTLNADIATWAVQNNTAGSPVIAVDLYTGILASDLSDGVHLNLVGSQKVADRWYAALQPFFKKP